MTRLALDIPKDLLEEVCRRHYIKRLAMFGSVLREDFGPDSDVDMLVEFEPEHSPGWEIVEIADDLSRLCGGRRVDVVNPKYLNRYLKERVLQTAAVQFESGDAA